MNSFAFGTAVCVVTREPMDRDAAQSTKALMQIRNWCVVENKIQTGQQLSYYNIQYHFIDFKNMYLVQFYQYQRVSNTSTSKTLD